MGLLLYSMCTKHTFECGYSCTVCPENSPLNGSVLGRHAHPESPSLIWVCSHAVCLQMGLFCTVCRSRKSTYVWVGFFTVCLEVSPLYGSVLVQHAGLRNSTYVWVGVSTGLTSVWVCSCTVCPERSTGSCRSTESARAPRPPLPLLSSCARMMSRPHSSTLTPSKQT